jgi:hypothetical protein
MSPFDFHAAIANIEHTLDAGEGYTLNLYLESGRVLYDYAYVPSKNLKGACPPHHLIRCDKDDQPPAYVPINSIEYLELSRG